MEYKSRLGRCS